MKSDSIQCVNFENECTDNRIEVCLMLLEIKNVSIVKSYRDRDNQIKNALRDKMSPSEFSLLLLVGRIHLNQCLLSRKLRTENAMSLAGYLKPLAESETQMKPFNEGPSLGSIISWMMTNPSQPLTMGEFVRAIALKFQINNLTEINFSSLKNRAFRLARSILDASDWNFLIAHHPLDPMVRPVLEVSNPYGDKSQVEYFQSIDSQNTHIQKHVQNKVEITAWMNLIRIDPISQFCDQNQNPLTELQSSSEQSIVKGMFPINPRILYRISIEQAIKDSLSLGWNVKLHDDKMMLFSPCGIFVVLGRSGSKAYVKTAFFPNVDGANNRWKSISRQSKSKRWMRQNRYQDDHRTEKDPDRLSEIYQNFQTSLKYLHSKADLRNELSRLVPHLPQRRGMRFSTWREITRKLWEN